MRKLLVTFIFLYICLFLIPQDRVAYDTLFQRVSRLPSNEIIKLADSYLRKECEDTAIVLYSIAYSRFNDAMSEEEKLLCALSYHKTANIYFIQGNYVNALDFYIKGMKICESCKNRKLLPQFYLSLGNVYCTFQDYEKGLNCYKRGYELCRTYPNKQYEYNLLTNMAGACSYLKDVTKATMYNNLAIRLTQSNDTVKKYMNLLNKGMILANEKRYREAVLTFHRSANYARQNRIESRYECSAYEELSKVYQILGNSDSTLFYLRMCNNIAESGKMVDILTRNLKMFSEFYQAKGDIEKSLHYKDRYLSLTDSIFNVREFNRIKNAQYLHEMDKIGTEISTLSFEKEQKEAEIKTQRKVLGAVFIGLVIIIGLLFWVYWQKSKLSKAYRNIFGVNREIMASYEHNKILRQQYEEKLKAANEEIKHYREDRGGVQAIQEETVEQERRTKYQGSNLNDDQRQLLLKSINEVMETTKEFCEEDFSLERLATLVNSNSKYVSQVINETYRKNFNIFVNEYRIREARMRLADVDNYGNYTIKAIAESLGYKSHATFVKAFKSITGIMPSLFQKMAKEEQDISDPSI